MKHMMAVVALGTMLASVLPAPVFAQVSAFDQVTEQDFIISAYYSPLPDQCCYVRGSYDADRILNGNGTHAADGTPVYPGMIAAPSIYPFGTKIDLPGMGVVTVHDRGGAIRAFDTAHRLDIWMGYGEEGLARAMAFGMRSLRGTVYPVSQSSPEESLDIALFPAPESVLQRFAVSNDDSSTGEELVQHASASFSVSQLATQASSATPLSQRPDDGIAVYGAYGEKVRALQASLTSVGVFDHEITGYFGEVTRTSLRTFLDTVGLNDESAEEVSATAIVYLDAATELQGITTPIVSVGPGSSPTDVAFIQRYLRHLGYYRGRTDGIYSSGLMQAVTAFQLDRGIVHSATEPGAGLVGPRTTTALSQTWIGERVTRAAERTFALRKVRDMLTAQDERVSVRLVRAAYMLVRNEGWSAL